MWMTMDDADLMSLPSGQKHDDSHSSGLTSGMIKILGI